MFPLQNGKSFYINKSFWKHNRVKVANKVERTRIYSMLYMSRVLRQIRFLNYSKQQVLGIIDRPPEGVLNFVSYYLESYVFILLILSNESTAYLCTIAWHYGVASFALIACCAYKSSARITNS